MIKLKKLIEKINEQDQSPQKITREAFLYMEPDLYTTSVGDKTQYAQCSTCMMWTGVKHNTCTIHGKDVKVTGDMTCALYVNGEPMPKESGHEMKSVVPKESGLYKGPVRCENCYHFDSNKCLLFKELNEKFPNYFELNDKVKPLGCCNAFVTK